MKEKISIPADEQEFHINYCPSEMGKKCEIYTSIPWLMKYLDKMAVEYPDQYTIIYDDQYSVTALVDFKLVKPRKPKIMSEETKFKLAQRLRRPE